MVPGTYTVRLSSGEDVYEQQLEVREDPRLEVAPAVRRAWTEYLLEIRAFHRSMNPSMVAIRSFVSELDEGSLPAGMVSEARELDGSMRELMSRTAQVYGAVSGWVGPPTADQVARLAYFHEQFSLLAARIERLVGSADPHHTPRTER